jgi:peptidoglycan hydrolase-like protein with peptidoglycan-binding domain
MLKPSPGLDEAGIFGEMTRKAVVYFQNEKWLVVDGIVGPCTRCVLDGAEKFNYLVPPARLIPQPTGDTCWTAATAMLTGRSVAEVIFRSLFAGVVGGRPAEKTAASGGRVVRCETDVLTSLENLAELMNLSGRSRKGNTH